MTYKDDLEKLRKEAGFDVNDPTSFARGKPDKPLSEDTSAKALSEGTSGSSSGADKRSPTGAFTSEEKKLTLWQKISLPFIRNSFMSVLFFMLITVIWIVMSHTILASIREVPRSTLILFMIKDTLFMLILGTVMYRIFISQFSNTYHLEEDYRKEFDRAEEWKAIQHSMMETMPETLVYTLDRDFRYTSFNNRHKYSMLRIWHEEINIGDKLLDHITDEEIKGLIQRDLENALKGEYFSQVNQFGENDLTAVYWQNYYAPILDEKRNIIGVSCFATNITALKQSQNKNLFLSYHDPLTQLYNRIYCEGEFDRADAEEIVPYSIIVVDIQGMRQINDNYGIETGDNLLIKVGELLTKAVKDQGTIARWGSDEFIVMLPGVDGATAEALVNICKCDFPGVTVNGVPLRAHFGFATRTDMSKTLPDILRSAERQSLQDRP